MSNDSTVAIVKNKKEKKKERKEKEPDRTEIPSNEEQHEKKKKKNKRKHDEKDADELATSQPSGVLIAQAVPAIDIEEQATKELNHKKSKKEDNEDASAGSSSRKDKKHKHNHQDQDGVKTNSSKKEKKRKRDEVGDVQAGTSSLKQKKKLKRQALDEEKSIAIFAENDKPEEDEEVDQADPLDILQPRIEERTVEGEEKSKKKKKKKNHQPADSMGSGDIANQSTSVQPHSDAEHVKVDAPSSVDIEAYLKKHSISIQSGGDSQPVAAALTFARLDIPSELQSAFSTFKEPSPIQACTWPPALQGQDVIGIAETGSGKTLAFGIPALTRILRSSHGKPPKSKSKGKSTVTTLIVAPTRELAIQTHDTLSSIGHTLGIASVAVFGGVDKGPQIKTLANGNADGKITRIIVGTPGRILDLVNDGACDLSGVNYLVLDEADRMLDKGFENDIRAIISHTLQGNDRQTLMFSATWPEAVRRLASSFLINPVRVTVGSDDLTANSRVEQFLEVFDDGRQKDSRLLERLRSLAHKKSSSKGAEESRILVFALYKKEASRVEGMLRRQGYSVGALHGDLSQSARMDALERFKTGETGLLVATDVAARGLDIPNVGAVINYTFPLTIEDYIHRIGRTGRGGKTGKSITFFTGENHERALAGELARVLREGGFDTQADLLGKFPMTIKKKTHSVYGAFFRDDITAAPTKIIYDD